MFLSCRGQFCAHDGQVIGEVGFCAIAHGTRGPMDKASAYGAGDCRFESCRVHFFGKMPQCFTITTCPLPVAAFEQAPTNCFVRGALARSGDDECWCGDASPQHVVQVAIVFALAPAQYCSALMFWVRADHWRRHIVPCRATIFACMQKEACFHSSAG
jgi:hypothetical protein